MNSEIFKQISEVAGDLFGVDPAGLRPESSPEQVPAWDSVQHLNLVLSLEEGFGIQFAPEEYEQMKTLGKIAEMVEQRKG